MHDASCRGHTYWKGVTDPLNHHAILHVCPRDRNSIVVEVGRYSKTVDDERHAAQTWYHKVQSE
eukprot:4208429-Pleurochrysis_carterae.AAC.1